MQKEIETLEFLRGVNFEFIDSLKNNGTKYLLIFDDSCEEICNSKAFVDIATAGRHRGLSTMYIKRNLFHQSKLGRDGKFYIPARLKQSKVLDNEHTKSLYSPSVPIIFPKMKKSFPSVLPKRLYPLSLRMHNKSAQRKPAKHKKTSPGKISKRGSTIVSKTYNLEAKKRHSGVRKKVTAH